LLTGRHASKLRGRGLNFEELRNYLPGDDIRTMDWKVTARTKRPHVRVYTEERERSVLVVVDQRLSMFFGSQVAMKSVTAAEAAALAAWRVLKVGDRIGAVVFNDDEIREVRPHRSRKNVMRILETVLQFNHQLSLKAGRQSNPSMLNGVLERVRHTVTHDYLVVLISDLHGSDEETVRLHKLLARHNDVLVALIYDPLEVNLPDAGRLVVSDGELQLEIDSGDSTLRQSFTARFNERLSGIQEKLLRYGVPVLPLHTAEAVAPQVRRLLGNVPRPRRG
jgi:uncharacterized protein (DUF58 family)